MKPPATVYSIDLFLDMTIDIFTHTHETTTLHHFWMKKDSTVHDLREIAPKLFKILPPNPMFYISPVGEHRCVRMVMDSLKLKEHLHMRIDCIPHSLPMNPKELKESFDKYEFGYIEIRLLKIKPNLAMSPLGFWKIKKGMSAESLEASVRRVISELKEMKISYQIRSHYDSFHAFKIEGKQSLNQVIESLASSNEWDNDRLVFYIVFEPEEEKPTPEQLANPFYRIVYEQQLKYEQMEKEKEKKKQNQNQKTNVDNMQKKD